MTELSQHLLLAANTGDVEDPEYPKALVTVIDQCVATSGWARPPLNSLWTGIEQSPGHKHIHTRMRWSSFKHRTGSLLPLDLLIY